MSRDIEDVTDKLIRMEREIRDLKLAVSRMPSPEWRAVEVNGAIVWQQRSRPGQ